MTENQGATGFQPLRFENFSNEDASINKKSGIFTSINAPPIAVQ
jgi:hypothetical protein